MCKCQHYFQNRYYHYNILILILSKDFWANSPSSIKDRVLIAVMFYGVSMSCICLSPPLTGLYIYRRWGLLYGKRKIVSLHYQCRTSNFRSQDNLTIEWWWCLSSWAVGAWILLIINLILNILGLQQSSRISFLNVFVTAVNLKINTIITRKHQQLG